MADIGETALSYCRNQRDPEVSESEYPLTGQASILETADTTTGIQWAHIHDSHESFPSQ